MGRVFRRGELKQAILVVLDGIGPAHGYGIMSELKERVGGGWKPSPGAIYPALVALVERGYVETTDEDGTQMYSLTPDGAGEAAAFATDERWASLAARAEAGDERPTVGSLLDRFTAQNPLRRRLPTPAQRQEIDAILERTTAEIETTLDLGDTDG